MKTLFSDRMSGVPKSFIREILKISLNPEIISFAGGLPNKDLFPAEALKKATDKVFQIHGNDCLQYANSEGYIKLREIIAERYQKKKNIQIRPENILILNGAQQGLDLLGKILLNTGDGVVVEEPGYLGALQAFSVYQPDFRPFKVGKEGVDIDGFRDAVSLADSKLIYSVPNFQNPSGITYSAKDRERMCQIIQDKNIILVEDDPYGELRFTGTAKPSFHYYLPEQTVLLGSFSKTLVPGFRIGWVAAPDHILQKLLIAKQAADLHTCHFTQYIFYQYLLENDVDEHIQKIVDAYGCQCRAMIAGMEKFLPDTISFTRPEGGMFLWGMLPSGARSMDLFDLAVKQRVVFVPGAPFYVHDENTQAFRLSFSCVDEQTIHQGLERLALAVDLYFAGL